MKALKNAAELPILKEKDMFVSENKLDESETYGLAN